MGAGGGRWRQPYPQLPVIVVGAQELHDVGVVTGGQDLDLHDIVLQFLLAVGLNYFGRGQGTRLLVLGLKSGNMEGQQAWSTGSRPLGLAQRGPSQGKHRPDVQMQIRGCSRRSAVLNNGQRSLMSAQWGM